MLKKPTGYKKNNQYFGFAKDDFNLIKRLKKEQHNINTIIFH